jgi:aminoglycoside phosphotransferase (APT) family kinase protein
MKRSRSSRGNPIPQELARSAFEQAVRAGLGSPPLHRRRVADGLTNHVYYVWTRSGSRGVVRMQMSRDRLFENEAWALAKCGALGLPVPEVLALQHHLASSGEVLSVMVESRLRGRMLKHVILSGGFGQTALRYCAREAGRLLAQINSIEIAGAGPLDASGAGTLVDCSETTNWIVLRSERLQDLGKHFGIQVEMDRALKAVTNHPAAYGRATRLLHGDFGTKHVHVSRRGITGIVDFELCRGGDPVEDVAYWGVVDRAYAPVQWLTAGYEEVCTLGVDFEHRLLLGMLRRCLEFLLTPTITAPSQRPFAAWVTGVFREDAAKL